jgi:beta-glucanase (GH16 family)
MNYKLYVFISYITLLPLLFVCSENGTSSDNTKPGIPNLAGWDLVWNDEFDGTSIDVRKWEHEVNGQGGGNNELQYYTDRTVNSRVEDGKLIIQALEEIYTGDDGTRGYTSARLRTANKGDWKYGRYDIKAKLPYGQGLWPAIWMLPTDWVYGGWAASGEIDIMELLGHQPNKIYGTLHYGGTYPNNTHSGGSFSLPNGSFSDEFHLFTLEWDTTEFRWYVDGVKYLTQNQWYSSGFTYPAPFNQRFHLLLNVAVGGNWPGNPDSTTAFPQTMMVDYVRVYKKATKK